MKPLDKVFWIRVAIGALTGLLLGLLTAVVGIGGENVIFIGILMYILTYYLARFTVSAQIPPKEARKLVTTGLGSYIMLVLFIWILVNTIFTTGFK